MFDHLNPASSTVESAAFELPVFAVEPEAEPSSGADEPSGEPEADEPSDDPGADEPSES